MGSNYVMFKFSIDFISKRNLKFFGCIFETKIISFDVFTGFVVSLTLMNRTIFENLMKIEVKRFPNRQKVYRHLRNSAYDKNEILSLFLLFLWFLNQVHFIKKVFFCIKKFFRKKTQIIIWSADFEPNQVI